MPAGSGCRGGGCAVVTLQGRVVLIQESRGEILSTCLYRSLGPGFVDKAVLSPKKGEGGTSETEQYREINRLSVLRGRDWRVLNGEGDNLPAVVGLSRVLT